MMKNKQGLFVLAIMVGLSACSFGGPSSPLQTLDLGRGVPDSLCSDQRQSEPIVIPLVEASSQINGLSVLWRESDQNLVNAYATYRWIAPPDRLFDERLRACFSLNRPVLDRVIVPGQPILRVSLDRFEQVFESGQSRGVVSARVILQKNTRDIVSKTFTRERAALSMDAIGGAQALQEASDELMADIQRWVNSVR